MYNLESLERLRINPNLDLSTPPTFCKINNRSALTAGNFSLIYGKKKSGKTFLLGSFIASAINNSEQLNVIKGYLPENKNIVLYFDTEQSQFHANRTVKRICALCGDDNPKNLISYGLRPLSPTDRLAAIEAVVTKTANVGLVAIDGIRDLLKTGINDEQAATDLTSLFLKWSYEYDLHIILLLHQNKADENARGHIGSEVVNKSETTISVTKLRNNRFKVVCEDSRDVPFDDFGFTIDDQGLPAAISIPQTTRKITDPASVSPEKHLRMLGLLFNEQSYLTYNNLITKLKSSLDLGRDTSSLVSTKLQN
jgi:AAA domain